LSDSLTEKLAVKSAAMDAPDDISGSSMLADGVYVDVNVLFNDTDSAVL
jgi:hypothetical protein